MRRKSLAQRVFLVTAVLITATGLTASSASAETTGTITGRLTSSDGTGVEGARVSLDGAPNYMSTMTGADGSYSFLDIPPSTVRVRFEPVGRPMQYAYGKTNYSEAAKITVTAGTTTTVNDTLIPVGFISGRLVDRGGAGVAFARVAAAPTSASKPYGSATADAQGNYAMAVVPGDYRVDFQVGDYSSGLRQFAYGKTNWLDADIFRVAVDQTVTVNDTLVPTGVLAGRVVTSTGAPVADAQVSAQGDTSNLYGRTDAQGNYRFAMVVPGAYRFSVYLQSGLHMYAPQARTWADAGLYTVTADQERTLNVTLLPTGSVVGRFTDNGTGVPDVYVGLSSDIESSVTARTNANGEYRVDAFSGNYKVHFTAWGSKVDQWAHGKVSPDNAQVFTVTPGTTLTVNETKLAAGNLRVTARDALTGAQIQEFWADIPSWWGSTQNGVLTMTDLPSGTYKARFQGPGYQELQKLVTINAGQETNLAITLSPMGTVRVTVVDSTTGAPLEGVCVILVQPKRAHSPDGCDATDAQGRVDLYEPAGSYNLIAFPGSASGYGMQWVGPTHGTGDQREAAVISVVNGQTTAAPTVRLDRAGSVSGRMTSETGQPIRWGEVGVLTVSSAVGGGAAPTSGLDRDGGYRLDGLGPYQWPLILRSEGHADQWSGMKASRLEAQKIQVTSGGTATYDHVMKVGTTITGTITDRDGTSLDGWLSAYNPDTGDYAGQTWAWEGESYTLRVLAPQQVRLALYQYWLDGTSFDNAERVSVGSSTIRLNLCVTAAKTMRECADIRPLPSQGTSPERLPPGAPIPTPTPLPSGDIPPTRR